LGAQVLGTYALAHAVLMRPVVLFAHSVSAVVVRSFADLASDRERFTKRAVEALTYMARISMPLLIGGVVVAEPLIQAVLSEKWQATIPLVRIFFVCSIGHILSTAIVP